MIAPQPFFTARGTPFSVLHRIRALCNAGHLVDLVTYPIGDDVDIEGLRIVRSRRPPFVSSVKIGPSFTKIALDIPLYFTARRLLEEHEYDVIHSHEEASFFATGLARKHHLKHVYDMHSSLPQQLENFGRFNLWPLRRIFESLERHVLRSCDGLITICPDLADHAVPLAGDKPHAMIENTGDDTRIFGQSDEDIRRDLGLEGRRIILYTGTFEAYQGLDLLLEAMAKLAEHQPEAHLLLVGGNPAQVAQSRRRAGGLGIIDRVTYVGMVSPLRIPSFVAAADVIASPRSRGTNTPLKIYGYLRSRKPLVATDLYTHTQTLDATTACLVPATPEGLAGGIGRVLDDPVHAADLAEQAWRRGQELFSDAAYLRKVQEFYLSVIDPTAMAQSDR